MIGALLLVCVGAALAAVMFRSGKAHAIGPPSSVAVAGSDGKPVRSNFKSPNSRSLTLEYDNGPDDEKFEPIKAPALTIQGDTFGHVIWVYLFSEGSIVSYFYLQPSERVCPFAAQSAQDRRSRAGSCFGTTTCFAQVDLFGS